MDVTWRDILHWRLIFAQLIFSMMFPQETPPNAPKPRALTILGDRSPCPADVKTSADHWWMGMDANFVNHWWMGICMIIFCYVMIILWYMLVIQSDLRFPFLDPIFSIASLALGGARLQEKSQELNAQVAPAEKSRPLASSGEFFLGTFSIIYLHNVPICGTYNYIYMY